ncbi:hypothetical protein [Desulfuromonas acetoxidans]|uniref:hypothetical protein n=1 Tax=Desulfuromonas acetoxidans TaxID=891 RepID=UPI00292F9674|nr:hypothetical protein [Desulfuromonas acetoxidans]
MRGVIGWLITAVMVVQFLVICAMLPGAMADEDQAAKEASRERVVFAVMVKEG